MYKVVGVIHQQNEDDFLYLKFWFLTCFFSNDKFTSKQVKKRGCYLTASLCFHVYMGCHAV